jgi:hypothetical protein
MYSCHSRLSVTPIRRFSAWVHFTSGLSRPPSSGAFAGPRTAASSLSSSSSSAGSGHPTPAARARPRYSETVPFPTLSALATFLCDSPRSWLGLRISFNLFIFSRFAAKESSSPGDTPRHPVTTPRKCSPCSGIRAHHGPAPSYGQFREAIPLQGPGMTLYEGAEASFQPLGSWRVRSSFFLVKCVALSAKFVNSRVARSGQPDPAKGRGPRTLSLPTSSLIPWGI